MAGAAGRHQRHGAGQDAAGGSSSATSPTTAVTVGRADPAYALLAPDPLRFRSRKVLDFAHFDVRELKRVGGGVTFDVHSTDGETWTSPQAQGAVDG